MHGGADLDQTQMNGATPAYLSAVQGHVDIIKMLAMCGCDLNITTEHGLTALDAASSMQARLGVWLRLVRAWAPLQVAVYEGRLDMVAWLLHTGRADPSRWPVGTPALPLLAQLTSSEVRDAIQAAFRPWRPAGNGWFGPTQRAMVFSVLLVANRLAASASNGQMTPIPAEDMAKELTESATCAVVGRGVTRAMTARRCVLPPELWLAVLSFVGRRGW